MKTITQRLMKILLVTLMMIVSLGINSGVVYADDISAKELKVGGIYYIDDKMVVLNEEPAYIQTDSESYPIKIYDSYHDYGQPAVFIVPTPEYESEHGWYKFYDMFTDEAYNPFSLYLNSEELDESETVIGIKCVSGDGTLSNPFTFELVFKKELAVGVEYKIGDTIQLSNNAYVRIDDHPDHVISLTVVKGVYTLPKPNYMLTKMFEFDGVFKNLLQEAQDLYLGGGTADQSKPPIGIKCVSGNGESKDNPFVFEPMFATTPSTDPTVIDEITFTITPPVAGTTVTAEWVEDDERYDVDTQNPYPQVNIPDGALYELEEYENILPAYWYDEDENLFVGTFEAGKYYYARVYIRPIGDNIFAEDLTENVTNGEFVDWVEYNSLLRIAVVKVQCKPAPQTKELKLNEVYYIGDTIEISEDNVWISFTDVADINLEVASKGKYVLPEPSFDDGNPSYWCFDSFISVQENAVKWGLYFMNEVSATKKPIGVKCAKGEGKKTNPYRFELLYDTPLASKVKAIQLNLDKKASNLKGAQESSIYFGKYKQSSNGEGGFINEPIKWRVLSNENNFTTNKQELFLLSDMVLDCKTYNELAGFTTWEDSSIRSWLNQNDSSTDSDARPGLNDGFLGSAFSDDEQKVILTSTVRNDANPKYDIPGGDDTGDQIFLLSIDEVLDIDAALEEENIDKVDEEKYGFTDSASRQAKATTYAISKGVSNENNYATYWLRSPGDDQARAAIVAKNGNVYIDGNNVDDHDDLGVRPAFKINLESVLFTSSAEGIKAQSSLGLKEVSETTTTNWKLTLLDETRKFEAKQTDDTTKDTYESGDKLSFTYKEAKTEDNEYISAIITDENNNVLYYGRLLQPTSATSTLETQLNVTLPDLEDGNYKLRIFNEQYNGGDNDNNLTDYASDFSTTVLTISNTVTPVTYEILEGNNASWSKGSTSTLDFRCARTPEITFDQYKTLLTSVQVDEKETTEYEIAPGSIIIKLKPELLEKLSIDTHTITINFNDGRSVSANFTVKAKGSSSTPSYTIPKTGVE